MEITSVDNKKIKKYVSLKNRKNRIKEKLFLVEGMHLCMEASKAGILLDILLLKNSKLEFNYDKEITYVTENVMKKLSSLTSIPNVIGVCKLLDNNIVKGDRLLLRDEVSDPGNLGTIIRSANAFNIDTIILSKTSVDIYNDKVLRASQGMIFKMNIVYSDLVDVINKLKKENYLILGTDVINGEDVRGIKFNKFALVMGNEGRGVSKEVKSLCDKNLYIKMNKNCESLNVGVATSILLYEIDRSTYE